MNNLCLNCESCINLFLNAQFINSYCYFFFQSTFAFADCVVDDQLKFKSYNFRIENDYFNNEDANYTSGVIFSGVTHDFKSMTGNECLPTVMQQCL